MVKIAFGIAGGVFKENGVGTCVGCGEGDDDHGLHVGVHHGVVSQSS